MPARNGLTTADAYTAANTLSGVFARTVTLTIANAAVLVQFAAVDARRGLRADAFGFNTEEVTLIPGVWGFNASDYPDGVAGVRVRSAVTGAPAIVNLQLS